MNRRGFLSILGLAAVLAPVAATPADAFLFDWEEYRRSGKRKTGANQKKNKPEKLRKSKKKPAKATQSKKKPSEKKKIAYKGREVVEFESLEKPGTIIVRTRERALYQVLDEGTAMRYLVAVGKEGFSWSGVARIGMKRENPKWTPPAEMIRRTPEYAKWKDGMPGGIPENPLGARALYLFDRGGDTMFRIHGTNAPSSIGTAASSGCIRMLNREVVELYRNTPIGTKVIVQ